MCGERTPSGEKSRRDPTKLLGDMKLMFSGLPSEDQMRAPLGKRPKPRTSSTVALSVVGGVPRVPLSLSKGAVMRRTGFGFIGGGGMAALPTRSIVLLLDLSQSELKLNIPMPDN